MSEYGIRIYSDDFKHMKWDEFCALLSGLSADSPLGRIVQIRTENDREMLKHFTKHQLKIRGDWRNRRAKQISTEDSDKAIEQLRQMFVSMI